MPEGSITEDQFLQAIRSPEQPSPSQPNPASQGLNFDLLPMSSAAIAEAVKTQASIQSSRLHPVSNSIVDFATKLGARAGVPFDEAVGVPFLVRTRLESRRDDSDKESFLKDFYGDQNVRKNQYGDFIVTVTDSGKPKDVLVNPLGADLTDLGAVAAMAPEVVGSVVGAVLSKGKSFNPGILQALKTLVYSAVGGEGAGLAKDLSVSDKPAGTLSRERAGLAAIDVAVGGTIGLFTKIATKLTTPFSEVSRLQFDARKAQEFFKENYGVELPLTPAESTGSTFLQRTEAMALQKPGASAPIRQLIEERNAKLKSIQDIALGGDLSTEEKVGESALAAIGGKTSPARFEVDRAAAAARKVGEGELQGALDLAVGSGPINKTALGASLRENAIKQRKAFLDASDDNYSKVFSNPLTQSKNISGQELAKDADELIAKLPSKEKTIESVDVDTYGSPVLRTQKGKEVLREFVPEGVLSKLNALKESKGSNFRLDELMQMRREVDNDIAQGEAIKGVQTRYLTQIRDRITARIKTGLAELDPQLLKDWEKANAEYATGVQRFKHAGISELFREPEQSNFVGDTEIVARATSGRKAQDVYTAYKDFFGEKSPEIRSFRRAIVDDVLSKSPLSDTVDAAGFVRRLDELAKDAPEVVTELFGKDAKYIRDVSILLKSVDGNLPEKELVEAMRSKSLTAEKVIDLMSAQSKRDALYKNSLIKSVEDGTLKAERIKPTDFVDKFAFKAEPKEVREVVSMLSDTPEVLDDVRRLTYQKILDQSTVTTKTGEKIIDSSRIDKFLSDKTSEERLRSILGNGTYAILENTRDILTPGAVRDAAFSAAGGMSAGTQIAGLVERGEFKYLDRALKNFVLAFMYSSRPVRAYLSNTLVGEQGSANAVNYMIASAPFVKAVAGTYGDEQGRKVMHQVKMSVDRFVQENPASGALPSQPKSNSSTSGPMSEADFLQAIRQ